MSEEKKSIKLCYVDFWDNFDCEKFILDKVIRQKFNVVYDKNDPDFVICSHFGSGYLRYKCPRILFLGEAKAADFNIYDYAIGFDDIKFNDRYLRYPLLLTYEDGLNKALKKHTFSDEEYLSREKFCNQVVSNGNGDKIRDLFFDALSSYKQVDSGGRYRNNLPDGKPVVSKEEFQKQYRFSLAIENSSFPGYITEKIIDAWAAGTVPIYWGDKDIAKSFNSESFIDLSDCSNLDEMVAKVKEIDEDNEKYLSMMKAPILKEGNSMYEMLNTDYLGNFLWHIVGQDKEKAYRRNSAFTMWGKAYEHHIMQWSNMENKWWFKKLRNARRKIKK